MTTKEQKREVYLQRMKDGRAKRKALEEEVIRLRAVQEAGGLSPAVSLSPTADGPQAPQPSQRQCHICALRLDSDLFERHMADVHGQLPEELRPGGHDELPPGTIVQPEGGLAFKVRWTRERLERDCNNWDGDPKHMHWDTIDPADIGSPSITVTYQSVAYRLIAGQENRVPNVISGQLRQSRRDTQRIFANSSVGSVLAPEEAGIS